MRCYVRSLRVCLCVCVSGERIDAITFRLWLLPAATAPISLTKRRHTKHTEAQKIYFFLDGEDLGILHYMILDLVRLGVCVCVCFECDWIWYTNLISFAMSENIHICIFATFLRVYRIRDATVSTPEHTRFCWLNFNCIINTETVYIEMTPMANAHFVCVYRKSVQVYN